VCPRPGSGTGHDDSSATRIGDVPHDGKRGAIVSGAGRRHRVRSSRAAASPSRSQPACGSGTRAS
jgi:hypothetical protein